MAIRFNTFPNFSELTRFLLKHKEFIGPSFIGAMPPLIAPGFTRTNSQGVEEVYSGALNYLEFVQMVKNIWEELHPEVPIIPYNPNRDISTSYNETITTTTSANVAGVTPSQYPPITIGYSLELRKPHTMDPKPRMRHQIMETQNRAITIYGQKFQNIVSFTVMAEVGTFFGPNNDQVFDDADASVVVDQIIEEFEYFMVEHTPIFKAAGASDLVYARRVSDSDLNKDGKDILQRQVMYMLTTERTYAIENARIQSVAVNARARLDEMYAATPSYAIEDIGSEEIIRDSETYTRVNSIDSGGYPTYEVMSGTELTIADHFQMSTPDDSATPSS